MLALAALVLALGTPPAVARAFAAGGESRRLEVPFFSGRGLRNACGPAALASVAGYWGAATSPAALAGHLAAPGRRVTTAELVALAERLGLWAHLYRGDMAGLEAKTRAGAPLIVLLDFGFGPFSIPHYAVVTGFDFRRPVIYFHSTWKEDSFLSPAAFARRWERAGYPALLALPPEKATFPLRAEQANSAGVFLSRRGDFAAAAGFFERALAREDYFLYRFNLAAALAGQGKVRAAAALYEAVIAESGYAPAYNNLAELVLEADPRRAEGLAREALARDDSLAPYYRDTLGRALILQGRTAEGEALVRAALEKAERDFPDLAELIRRRAAECRRRGESPRGADRRGDQ